MTASRVPHPIEVLYGGGAALACGREGQVLADELHGLFVADTRVLSTYKLVVGGERWQLLGRTEAARTGAQWRFQSPAIRDPREGSIPEAAMFLTLARRVNGGLHDDIAITSYRPGRLRTTLVLQLDADFADVFEVKEQRIAPNLAVQRIARPDGVSLVYERGDFRRALHARIRAPGEPPQLVGSLFVFDLELGYAEEWRCCVHAEAEVGHERRRFVGDPHESGEGEPAAAFSIRAPAVLEDPFRCGLGDLESLALSEHAGAPYVAAGVPWFYTLFGRDSLLPGLMAGLAASWPARGSLEALGDLQARERDDWRDAEPGKLPHELRRGELASTGAIPHTPYYGTHDAPSLYCLALWNAWRWTGDRGLLDAHMATARAALRWCDELGDCDGDGLQEYRTRSRKGYANQGWKDAGDAILHADGREPEPPVATVELQGYLYAARLAMSELLEEVDDEAAAEDERKKAERLRALVEDRFWLPSEGFYALALDGRKEPLTSAGSNAGQLLWTGLPAPERAHAVGRRLLEPDLFAGWGLRTLSSGHPRYSPLSYQRGSVWPHDTVLAAAGCFRYGLHEEGAKLLEAVLEAARTFEADRLPELFCGFDRELGPPVPYREANVPQAWAAAVPILAAQLLLGLVPDAPRGRCSLSPWLPEWLPRLEVAGIEVGAGRLDVALVRSGEEAQVDRLEASGVEAVLERVEAPLWGRPRAPAPA